jgi:hypothetical protein
MAKRYLYKNIRALLTTGFTDEDLRILCFEEPEFRAVYENWPRGASKATFVQDLIDRAERRVQLDHLLDLAKEQNPAQYKQHQPYYEGEPIESVAPATPASETKPEPIPQPASAKIPKKAVELFFSYAHEDEVLQLLQRQGVITAWHDREITAGSEWTGTQRPGKHLRFLQPSASLFSLQFGTFPTAATPTLPGERPCWPTCAGSSLPASPRP